MSKVNVVFDNSFTLIKVITCQSFIKANWMIRLN